MNSKANFDWQLVQAFLAVLEAGSLLGAAKRLQATQPTLGRQIAELERQLGTPLFERTGRGLKPTDAAHKLAEPAQTMRAAANSLREALRGETEALRGTVVLSASQPVAHGLLPPLLARMTTDLPHICIELVATNELSNLLQREADIALRMVQPTQASTVAKRVGAVQLGAFAHQRYLAQRPAPQSAADLALHSLIADRSTGLIERGFEQLGVRFPTEQVVFKSDDFLAQWGAVRAGIGIGFMAQYLGKTDAQVQRVLPQLPVPSIPMWLVAHREVRSSARVKAVFDWLGRELPAALA